MKCINLAIADDHSIFRKFLADFLDSFDSFNVLICASNGQDLLNKLGKQIDLVILDLDMPVLCGKKALNSIRKRYGQAIKVIILSMHPAKVFAKKYMAAGANAYLNKTCEPDELLKAIEVVMQDGVYFEASLNEERPSAFENKQESINKALHGEALSFREKEVLTLLCKGFSCPKIARGLNISIRTVESHRANIATKYGVRSLPEMMETAIKRGDYSILF